MLIIIQILNLRLIIKELLIIKNVKLKEFNIMIVIIRNCRALLLILIMVIFKK